MKKLKNILTMMMALAMLCVMCVPAFAAEATSLTPPAVQLGDEGGLDSGAMPANTGGWCTQVSGIGSTYKEVAYAGSGFNCNVRLTMTVPYGYAIDVAMYNGSSCVWEEQNAFNGERTLWVGNNVTSIRVRVRPTLGGTLVTTYTCGVDVYGS